MSVADDPPPPYQAQDPPSVPLTPTQPVKSIFYHIYHTHSGNYNILLDDKTPAYYIKNHILRTPDLVVHRGNGDYDREVANCNFPEFGTNYAINLYREPNKKSTIVQTKMTINGHFITTVPIPDTNGATVNTRRHFAWKQTPTLKELIDEETSQTAVFMRDMAFGLAKCFVLEIQVPYGYGFELMVVTTAVVIYESQRRESSKPSGASHASRRRMHGGAAANQMMGAAAGGGF
ncbi:hypothetical protein V8E51_017278 [Hyaloscypha variabilis]|uniref:Uncharacterized protein n=1 Tax=Hyaloscypha variabilis (strain UAMH 11265 / GT02V1 / F) TaxID=1149755 RepID=A0A2J6RHP4_HYAVF|nr:hypothetical protein L207DRAFT_513954 [Hyaloscypha variabilis F]